MEDLFLALVQGFPNCRIHPFGSTVTNLHLKNSDIDIYVEVHQMEKMLPPDVLPSSLYVKNARGLLMKYGNVFKNVCCIPQARTPIVKFLHVPTNFKCDVNFKNMLGICNNRLIVYYLSLDLKLTTLMIFIKYWALSHELTGIGGKFSHYALNLMFIFYLQSEYHLPSVSVLQTVNSVNIQDGWNGGFQCTPTYSASLNNHDFITVLLGFYAYYSKFDFSLNTICPYLGKIIPKTDLLQPDLLTNIFYYYKENVKRGKPLIKVDSAVCLQDPFELNCNVTTAVKPEHLEEFAALCKNSVSFLEDGINLKEIIYKLLTEEAELFSRKCVVNDLECRYKLLLSANLTQLNEIITLKGVTDNNKQVEIIRLWQEEVKVVVSKILQEIMRFTINADKEEQPDGKSQRLLTQKDIHNVPHTLFHCYGYYNFWDGHKMITKDLELNQSLSLFEQQLAITKYIFAELYKGKCLQQKIIEFNIDLRFSQTPAEVAISINNVKSVSGYFKKFCLYFIKILPLLFQAHIIGLLKKLNEKSD